MKKLLFTILAAAGIAGAANAQIQKGNVLVGANIANISFALDKPNAFRLDINPKAAWFIQDGLAIGADVKLGLATQGTGAGTDINYGIGALGRYYGSKGANELVNHSRFFAEATVGIDGQNPAGGKSTNGLGISFGPGFAYFITPNIGLETLLKYNGTVGFGGSAYRHGLNLGVGLQIYLPGRATAKKVANDMN